MDLEASCMSPKGGGAILQKAAVSVSAIDEEAARRLSRGVEYRFTNCLTYVSRCEKAARHHFGRVHPLQDEAPPKFHKDYFWTKISARIKGGFSFVIFPLSVCGGVST